MLLSIRTNRFVENDFDTVNKNKWDVEKLLLLSKRSNRFIENNFDTVNNDSESVNNNSEAVEKIFAQ